jgi:hypothetical protein
LAAAVVTVIVLGGRYIAIFAFIKTYKAVAAVKPVILGNGTCNGSFKLVPYTLYPVVRIICMLSMIS